MAGMKNHTKPFRTAVIGFGISGRVFHAPLIAANPSYSLDMIVTSNSERAAAAATLYPRARVVGTTAELFADASKLDLVVLSTPPVTHFELTALAISQGLHVVIDKPFAANSEQAEELIARARRAGVELTVFQNRRWDADYLTLRKLLDNGQFGEARSFESRFEWWRPDGFQNWRDVATISEAGGILHDLGAHLIDQAIQLFGPVAQSHGEIGRRADLDGYGADQEAFVSLLHDSGVRSRLWMNGMAPQVGPRFHVLGSKAGYTKWGLDGQEPALDAGASPTDVGYGVESKDSWGRLGVDTVTELVRPERGSYPEFYRLLALALSGTGTLPVDPSDSLTVLRIIERIHSQA